VSRASTLASAISGVRLRERRDTKIGVEPRSWLSTTGYIGGGDVLSIARTAVLL
jgi:hypothetical protein